MTVTLVLLLLLCPALMAEQPKQPPSKELRFCLDQPSTSSTLQTFWQDASGDCDLDPQQLSGEYAKVLQSGAASTTKDRCHLLLLHQMRKRLLAAGSQQLEEAFVMRSVAESGNSFLWLQELGATDKQLAELVWQRALSSMHISLSAKEIIEEIFQFKSNQLQLMALEMLLRDSDLFTLQGEHLLPLLAYKLQKLLHSANQSKSTLISYDNLQQFYERLPENLRNLHDFNDGMHSLGFLNLAHWEYLYAPRDNGPDADRRLPLTWSQEKNATDTDGHFMLEFNDQGLLAIGSRFGAAIKFLYADLAGRAPYFWIGSGTQNASQWWQVIWPKDIVTSESGIVLQNEKSKEYLCATLPYDENRRYVVLQRGKEQELRAECHWMVKVF